MEIRAENLCVGVGATLKGKVLLQMRLAPFLHGHPSYGRAKSKQ